jgi:hypothetical protein
VSLYFDDVQKEPVLKTNRTHKSSKNDPILISVAESIGSTLGSLAAKADAAKRALTGGDVATKLERRGKKLVRKGKKIVHDLKKTKLARSARRSLRRTSVNRAALRRRRSTK